MTEAQKVIVSQIDNEPLWWLRNCTKTQNPHWKKQGFKSPFAPFPEYRNLENGLDYLDYAFDFFKPIRDMRLAWSREQIIAQRLALGLPPEEPAGEARLRIIEKSRTMLGTWSCIGYFTHWAQTVPGTEFLFQSQTQDKAEELIEYAKILWDQQDQFLKDTYKLDRKVGDFPKDMMRWDNAARILAIPSDPDKVRMFHPTGMLMDECAFLGEFRKNLDTALPAAGEIVIALSSAGPSEFAEFVNS